AEPAGPLLGAVVSGPSQGIQPHPHGARGHRIGGNRRGETSSSIGSPGLADQPARDVSAERLSPPPPPRSAPQHRETERTSPDWKDASPKREGHPGVPAGPRGGETRTDERAIPHPDRTRAGAVLRVGGDVRR